MKPCPSCGFELFDYAQRCSNCGLRNLIPTTTTKPVRTIKKKKKASAKKKIVGGHIFRVQEAIPKVLELKRDGTSNRQVSQQTGLALNTIKSILPSCYKYIAPIKKHYGSTIIKKCRICGSLLPSTRKLYCSEKCYEIGHHQAQTKSSWRRLHRLKGKPLPKSLAFIKEPRNIKK